MFVFVVYVLFTVCYVYTVDCLTGENCVVWCTRISTQHSWELRRMLYIMYIKNKKTKKKNKKKQKKTKKTSSTSWHLAVVTRLTVFFFKNKLGSILWKRILKLRPALFATVISVAFLSPYNRLLHIRIMGARVRVCVRVSARNKLNIPRSTWDCLNQFLYFHFFIFFQFQFHFPFWLKQHFWPSCWRPSRGDGCE